MAEHTIAAMRRSSTMRDWLVYGYIAVTVAALLPLGSVGTAPFTLVAIAVCVLALAAAGLLGAPSRARPLFRMSLLLLAVLCGWVLMQSLDLSWAGLAHPAWKDAEPVTGPVGGAISLVPGDTPESLLRLAIPFLLFLTGLILSTSDERAAMMVRALALAGGFIAVFALVQFLFFPGTLLVMEKRHYLNSLTAVFVNRNTAATFLGLVALLLTGLVTLSLQQGALRALRDWILNGASRQSARLLRSLVLQVILLLATLTALMLTTSRAGVASTFAALFFLLPVLAANWQDQASPMRSGRRSGRLRKAARMAAAMALILVVAYALTGRAQMRAEMQGLEDGRFCIMPGLLDAIAGNWWTGTGFGTFLQAFPPYRPAECGLAGIWDRAHNSYLEALLGLGVIALAAIVSALAILLSTFVNGLRHRQKARLYPAVAIAAVILVSLHALLDFSLQIPGVALYFAALLAPLASISMARSEKTAKSRRP